MQRSRNWLGLVLLVACFLVLSLRPASAQSVVGHQIDHGTALPTTCSASKGQIYFLTSGTVGLYGCKTDNTWTVTGGGFAFVGVLASIPATCTVGDLAFITNATAGQNIYECAATNTWTQQLNSGSGGASTALDNLASVSINTSLLAQTGADLGSTTKPFRNLFLFGAGTYATTYMKLTGTPTSTRTWTLQDATDTFVGLATADILTNKTLTTPTIGSFTNATHNHTNAAGGGTLTLAGAAFANQGTTTTVLHGNGAGNPSFAAVNLASGGDITGILTSANGGTGNGFAKLSGPATSEKTFTLPNASATVLTDNAVVTVAQGGTGTGSTLTGLVRGNSSAMTAAELSGDATTSGSNAVTVAKVNGITYSATAAAHTVEVITTANTTATAKVIPDCTDTGGNHLNFTQSTDLFSCGTSSSGGSATWGAITGTLSSQTDLNTALGLKAPLASPALTGLPTVTGSNATSTNSVLAVTDTTGNTGTGYTASLAPLGTSMNGIKVNLPTGDTGIMYEGQLNAVEKFKVDSTGAVTGISFTANGSTAGVIDFPQGSTNSGGAPCTTATSICEQAPAVVTSYVLTKPGAAPTIASIKITDACGSSICTESFRPKDLVMNVASDFITAANTNLQNITGLGFTFPANVATIAAIDCDLEYNQQTAAVADAFGVQDVTVAPTSLYSTGFVQTAATTWVDTAAAALTTTTATNIIAMTPSAITTLWHARLHILVEQPSNASTSALNIMVKTGTSGDTVTVKRGSFCSVKFQ